ncbi:hypothetical protein M9Y10_025714 [Tritrichomonas musculus]|uniref:Uncharacterized protein n=1 Tax=Tritrichomonas musculus TaxID=1915356 RepID=A0ABR2H9G0_9EUKA
MIDKFIEIESNLFSINKFDIETRERLDILSSIFNAIGKIELFDTCEKQYKQSKKDFPKESLVTHLNKIKREYKVQYYKIEAEKGNVKATNAYVWMLEYGIGVDKDVKEELAMNNILCNNDMLQLMISSSF